MSYHKLEEGTRWGSRPPTQRGDSSSSPEAEEIARRIRALQQNLLRSRKQIELLGTRHDSKEHRHKLRQLVHQVMNEAKDTEKLIAKLSDHQPGASREQQSQTRLQQQRLAKDFLDLYAEFRAVQTEAHEKENQFELNPKPFAHRSLVGSELDDENNRQLLMEEESKQLEFEDIEDRLQMQTNILDDREDSIRDIEHEIGLVNEVFKDLANLVEDQGMVIDHIEQNIVDTLQQSKDGTRDVHIAARHQRASRKKMCVILVILVIVFAVM
eukprot:793262_1